MNKLEKRYNQEISLLGERLRKLREQKKLTQLDMEINSGINRTEISRIENGQKNIEFLTLVKLAIALDAELEDFFLNLNNHQTSKYNQKIHRILKLRIEFTCEIFRHLHRFR